MPPQPIKATAHGAIDYGFVALMATAPVLLKLNSRARKLAWAFAATQGTVNVLTDTPVGLKRLMRLRTHGWLEAASGPLFLGLPVALGAVAQPRARNAWLAAFGLLLGTYLLTNWKPEEGEAPVTP